MLKINNKDTFVVNFEHILHLFLVFFNFEHVITGWVGKVFSN